MLTNPEASNMPGARLPTDTGVKLTPRKNPAARTSKAKIPRPRNTWLVYRSEKSKQIHESRPGMSAGAICKLTLITFLLQPRRGLAQTNG